MTMRRLLSAASISLITAALGYAQDQPQEAPADECRAESGRRARRLLLSVTEASAQALVQ